MARIVLDIKDELGQGNIGPDPVESMSSGMAQRAPTW